jgi:hypothetical protein
VSLRLDTTVKIVKVVPFPSFFGNPAKFLCSKFADAVACSRGGRWALPDMHEFSVKKS